ncbi:MAG TPA: PEGA domain-containing protein [Candidatus Sulfotelmatobacter sp.]|jgi:serine/threonine-protein kinase
MPTKIGHFEILSELSKSPTGVVYKVNDTESGQTIALKAIQLSAFGDGAAALEQVLLAEVEACKVLSISNITKVSSASVIDGQFCAAMEYIQGNSIATMLARNEGFSIWDLLDIGRQLTTGLEHAKASNIVHYSLEPAKIMCGWDGTVKILGYGVSQVGNMVQLVPDGVPSILHYMSPEQVLSDVCDSRSNLFSLGAMLYEMVTERKAFDGEDTESLRQCILDTTPTAPIQVNPKVHPVLSNLIIKALAKDPAQRYQSARELLDDLENCKESRPAKKTEAPKAAVAPKAAPVAPRPSPVAQAKSVAPSAAKQATPVPTPAAMARPATPSASKLTVPAIAAETKSKLAKPVSRLAAPKTAAAAAGAGSGQSAASPREVSEYEPAQADLSTSVESNESSENDAPEMLSSTTTPRASMSSSVADEPEIEAFEPQVSEEVSNDSPKIAVDPMMAGGGSKGSAGVSFSEMTELPPLKEVYIPPPPPPPPLPQMQSAAPATTSVYSGNRKAEEKPRVQPREVAEKAIKEIKNVPPKLMLYAIGGAVALILVIGIAVTMYVHGLNSDDDSGSDHSAAVTQAPAQPQAIQSAPPPQPVPAQPVAQPSNPEPPAAAEPEPVETRPAANSKAPRSAKKKSAPAPAAIPGGLAVDSTPQGAQVQVDGQTDPSWVTPFALSNLQPGVHSITISKPGYATDTRTVNVVSANRATATIHLAQLMATLVVKSDPPGANIYVDGRDVGTKTPAQVSVDKGQHVVLVRMPGYIDETMNAQFVLGQTFNFSPTLRSLGNTENIKTVGKFKLFGGKGAPAGQALVSIHTTPKGAQVAINQHMLDKMSPVDVALDPGNYVVDITLSGYAPVHKIVTADKGGKVVVDEAMQPQ